ncbi:F-box only protein 39-like [Physella acuta]|uniref:F-box only protein 39-like n=1 Tax=Physella acuta TaxID=109671 RepID=UPI0027DBF7A3|nr:F-box only protein 39-like [Physella acuta]
MNKRKCFPQTCELSVKRRRVQECPPSSQTPDQGAWDEIPYVVLLHIFKHLDSKSRCAASTVCKRWNFAFKNASLWRSVALTIGGLNAKHTAFKCIRFLKLFGPHLRELRISCQVLSYSNSLLITDTLHAMFLLLPESGLRVLVLDNLEADNHECWRYPRLAASLVTSLVNFVDSQRSLEQFSMKSAKFEEQNGIRLLQALGQPSASNLSSLDLEAFFSEHVSVANCAAFKTALTTFSHVETLALNYWYLSDELMKQMALAFRRLKRLKVTCLWDSDNDGMLLRHS